MLELVLGNETKSTLPVLTTLCLIKLTSGSNTLHKSPVTEYFTTQRSSSFQKHRSPWIQHHASSASAKTFFKWVLTISFVPGYLEEKIHWTLEQYIDYALLLAGSPFTVGVADEEPCYPPVSAKPGNFSIMSGIIQVMSEPYPAMPACPESAPVMAALPQPAHKMAAISKPVHKMAAIPEPVHKMATIPKPVHKMAAIPKPVHKMAVPSESPAKMAAMPEPHRSKIVSSKSHLAMSVAPKANQVMADPPMSSQGCTFSAKSSDSCVS
ncbi:Translation initiation factor IF-2 [Labeo rohita]|uniref:Translation initiation factor IF-2 n=1 Tax=Labeo rohita TaxID=84645 RepID=A0ABQ8N1K6_LABRO|nr:Translation initiation factor IF-2 [Labeo rohita]